jgi:hypothetical protein
MNHDERAVARSRSWPNCDALVAHYGACGAADGADQND